MHVEENSYCFMHVSASKHLSGTLWGPTFNASTWVTGEKKEKGYGARQWDQVVEWDLGGEEGGGLDARCSRTDPDSFRAQLPHKPLAFDGV